MNLEGYEDLEVESLTISKQDAYDMLVQGTLDYPKNREWVRQKARAHRVDMREMQRIHEESMKELQTYH